MQKKLLALMMLVCMTLGMRTTTALADEIDEDFVWQEEVHMNIGRSRFMAEVVDGKIYVIGGGNPRNRALNSVEIYEPITNEWVTGTSMPVGKYAAASAVVGNKIYIIGGAIASGSGTGYTYANSVHIYDTVSDS